MENKKAKYFCRLSLEENLAVFYKLTPKDLVSIDFCHIFTRQNHSKTFLQKQKKYGIEKNDISYGDFADLLIAIDIYKNNNAIDFEVDEQVFKKFKLNEKYQKSYKLLAFDCFFAKKNYYKKFIK